MSATPTCAEEIPNGALVDISHFPDMGGCTGSITCTAAAWRVIRDTLMESPFSNDMAFRLCLTAMRAYHRDTTVAAACISVGNEKPSLFLQYRRDRDGVGFTIMLPEEK